MSTHQLEAAFDIRCTLARGTHTTTLTSWAASPSTSSALPLLYSSNPIMSHSTKQQNPMLIVVRLPPKSAYADSKMAKIWFLKLPPG